MRKDAAGFLTMLGSMFGGGEMQKTPARPVWKPQFTETEMAEIRDLPKRERELKVRELRAKYLAQQEGTTTVTETANVETTQTVKG